MDYRLAFMLIAVALVLSAGCVSMTGEDPTKITTNEKHDIADMIQVEKEEVHPLPIEPDTDFTLDLYVKNIHKSKKVENLLCDISDEGIFTLKNAPEKPDDLYPGMERVFEFNFHSPSSSILVNNLDSAIEYICTYTGTARKTMQFAVISKQARDEYQLAGKPLPVSIVSSEEPGPLKLKITSDSPYFISGRDAVLRLKLENDGAYGIIGSEKAFNKLPPGSVSFYIESDAVDNCKIQTFGPGKFACGGAVVNGERYCKCINTDWIQLIEGSSASHAFLFHVPSDAAPRGVKRYIVTGEAEYMYILRNQVMVNVKGELV